MERHHQAPADEHEPAPREDRTGQAGHAPRVRALQRSAGNRAVSALVAREPDPPKPDVKREGEGKGGAAGVATLPEVGAIPILSVRFAASSGGGTGSGSAGREGQKQGNPRELSFTSRVGEHSAKLFQASAGGKQMAAVDVVVPGVLQLQLLGAFVTSYSATGGGGDPMEAWSLVFESSKQP